MQINKLLLFYLLLENEQVYLDLKSRKVFKRHFKVKAREIMKRYFFPFRLFELI